MDMDGVGEKKIKLEKPINIADILGGQMSEFKISEDYEGNTDDEDEIFDDADYDNSREFQSDGPIDIPYDEIKQDMTPIHYGIFKKIMREGTGDLVPVTAKVVLDFCGFTEGNTTPFETTWINCRPRAQKIGEDMLPGFYYSLLSMRQGEEAKFIIPYQMMYGIVGCPPINVPPKADCLFLIRLIAFKDVGDSGAIDDNFIEEYNSLDNVVKRVEEVRKSARMNFAEGKFEEAAKDFKKCIAALKFCQKGDREEERITMLQQMYVNVCVCYNKLERPLEVLKMRDNLMSALDTNCKAIFQIARAYFAQGDYDDALRYLQKAQKLEPNNPEVAQELKRVNEANETYKRDIKAISQKALRNTKTTIMTPQLEKSDSVYQMLEVHVKKFLENATKQRELLPLNMAPNELAIIESIAKENNLRLENIVEGSEQFTCIVKT